ncbi:hypothetical protein D0864_10899 [Hortaea werneckii]|uniref:DUF7730 domain-containing protein n=1 Tax=Hortaea werneckii TaxID=91943 RepID=A0A3M7E193_HORWE|nr:hypothetical protein D0864_10899 [Hortaea werneckii]RMZ02012.1 hypothetical protein D0862_06161 [Hortaea werneckii]
MIAHGQYAGLKAVVFAPTITFPFVRLPVELRQMVYERLFCRNCTPKRRERVGPNATRPEPRHMSLLMTSKPIYTEAIPFLYNGHNFFFHNMSQFNRFVQELGTAARFLTSALVTKSGSKLTEHCYTLLNQLESLQRITLTLPAVPTERLSAHIDKQWEHAKLFLLSAGVDEKESMRRLDLITFRVGPTQRNVLGSDGKAIKVITTEMNELCKKHLRKKISRHFQAGTEAIRL